MHISGHISLAVIGEHLHFGVTFALGLVAFVLGRVLRRLHTDRSEESLPETRARLKSEDRYRVLTP